MPKRPPAQPSPSKSPQRKRSKVAPGQHTIADFFSAPKAAPSGSVALAKGKSKASPEIAGHDVISADEAYAWEVARQDGIDFATLQKLEDRAGRAATPKSVEVIDVDELDIPLPEATSSATVSATITDNTCTPQKVIRTSRQADKSAVPPTPRDRADICDVAEVTYQSLSVDPAEYVLKDDWPSGAPAPYSFLAHTLATLSETRSRIRILNTLTNTLRSIVAHDPSSLLPALYLLSNNLSPPYISIELGIGPSVISKAIQQVSGLSAAKIRRLYTATGDPGDVAFNAKSNIRTLIPHPPLTIKGVYESLLRIVRSKGQGAAKQKQSIVEKLLVSAKGEETRYIVRTLSQNLRVGAVRTSILTALARALAMTSPPRLSETANIPADSPYRVPSELLMQLKPVSKDPKKKSQDEDRTQFNEILCRAEALMKKVYVQHPNYDHIVESLIEGGLDGLEARVPLAVGTPLLPTLGSPTRSLDEIYDRLGFLPFSAEFKYDGQRAQIHAKRDQDNIVTVDIFSRHLENMTDKYPDVVSLVQHMVQERGLTSCIIDAEVVAIDAATGNLKTFQELSNRARKDVKLSDIKVSVCIYAFDLMLLDNEILLEKPFRDRRSLLRSQFPPYKPQQEGAAWFDHVKNCESEDGREAVEEFWQMAVNSAAEGLMVKLLDNGDVIEEPNQAKDKPRRKPLPATYEPDKRTSAWLKLKKDYVTGLGDSLDLVPIGAWHGNGRKVQWWSPILLAVWDPNAGKLVAVCKCMSGFTDAFYKDLRERYPEDSETCSRQPLWEPACDPGGLKPEVYFKPQEVWEIRGADITLSPVSVAALGLVSQQRGLSLRFPRFIKIRDDKRLSDASTPEFLANMWRNQEGKGKDHTGVDDGELLDVDLPESEAESEYSV